MLPETEMRQQGCLCYMPLAAWSVDKDCWYVETTGNYDFGWQKELNGLYIEKV